MARPLYLSVGEAGSAVRWAREAHPMTADRKSTKILARTFFNQLVAAGYTPNQIIDVSGELIDLVSSGIREAGKPQAVLPPSPPVANQDWRETA